MIKEAEVIEDDRQGEFGVQALHLFSQETSIL